MIIPLFISFFYILFAIIQNLRAIFPYYIYLVGTEPKKILSKEFLNNSDDKQLLKIKLNEIENYQHRIEYNQSINNKRQGYFKSSLISMFCLLVTEIIYLIFHFLCF